MSLTAAASGFVVFLLSVSGTVYLHLHYRYIVACSEQPEESFREKKTLILKSTCLYLTCKMIQCLSLKLCSQEA